MALSATIKGSTGNKYIDSKIVWGAVQSITGNYSDVTATLHYSRNNKGYTTKGTWKGGITINGTRISGSKYLKITYNSNTIAISATVRVYHDDDGSKSITISADGSMSGTTLSSTSVSGTATLDTIPRKSSLTVANGTLGTAQTLTVTRKANSFTHTITYDCGSASGTIVTKSNDTSISFTPPISLSSQNTSGTTVSVKFTIITYSGSTNIGENSYTVTMTIPTSVKPSCSISVIDAAGYYSTYGKYVKGQSKFKVTIMPTISYGSDIASYSATANGVKYASANFTTGVLTSSGKLTITATVTDKRGRSGTATITVDVYDYSVPQINLFKVKRCLVDGTEDINGEFCQVTFSAVVTALDNLNSANYVLEYKKSTDEKYTRVVLTDFANLYEVTEGTHVFPAESGSSYNVRILTSDNFTTNDPIIKTAPLSTATVIEHWRADGKGMGIGKIGEIENGLDVGYQLRAFGGFINILLEPETDLNDVRTPNTYYGENVTTYNYANCPISSGTFTLEVVSAGDDGQVKQRLTTCSKIAARTFERFFYQSTWGEWACVYDYANTLLWDGSTTDSGGWYMLEAQTITLPQKISEQPSGIVLVFQAYKDGSAQPNDFNTFFIPKRSVADNNGQGRDFICSTTRFGYVGIKYIYISDTQLKGHASNNETGTAASGITYTNGYFVLTKVYGV